MVDEINPRYNRYSQRYSVCHRLHAVFDSGKEPIANDSVFTTSVITRYAHSSSHGGWGREEGDVWATDGLLINGP